MSPGRPHSSNTTNWPCTPDVPLVSPGCPLDVRLILNFSLKRTNRQSFVWRHALGENARMRLFAIDRMREKTRFVRRVTACSRSARPSPWEFTQAARPYPEADLALGTHQQGPRRPVNGSRLDTRDQTFGSARYEPPSRARGGRSTRRTHTGRAMPENPSQAASSASCTASSREAGFGSRWRRW